jgi:hypothetical protein
MPLLSSAADPICPTFAAGSMSIVSGSGNFNLNNDSAAPGVANGYVNQCPSITVGSFNNDWNNDYLTQTKTPTYSSGLLSFGNTGLQS